MSRPPVGIRNNNPGNLRFINQNGAVLGERGFARFNSYDEGVAALDRQLNLYYSGQSAAAGRIPRQNIEEIITIYAPPSDNNPTASYINTVANNMGLNPTEPIPIDRLPELRNEIIRFELGIPPEEARQIAIAFNNDVSINQDTTPTTPPVSQQVTENIAQQQNRENSAANVESSTTQSTDKIFPDWQENILSKYDNPSYYFRLFMMSEKDERTASGLDGLASQINSANKIIIAETGVTGINIESVTIKTVTSPNSQTAFVNISELKIRLFEPMGMTLYDRLRTGANNLTIYNYLRCPYYLELKFHGYGEDGSHNDNLGPEGPNSKKWVWKLMLSNIESEFTAGGSIYDLTLFQNNDLGTLDNYFALDATLNIEGRTVSDIKNGLIQHKKESEKKHYGYVRNIFNIKFEELTGVLGDLKVNEKNINPNPESWEFLQKNVRISSTGKALNLLDNENVSFTRGTNIGSVIEQIFAGTTEGHLLTNRSNDEGVYSNQSEYIIVPWILTRVNIRQDNLSYDFVSNDYNREITYIVKPYITSLTTASRLQVDPNDKRNRNEMLKKLAARVNTGKFIKKYDYLFTGENTEVLNLNFKFDTLYKATVPMYGGEAQYGGFVGAERTEQSAVGRFLAANAEINKLILERDALNDSIKNSSNPDGQERARLSELNQEISTISSSFEALAVEANIEQNAIAQRGIIQSPSLFPYLEDLQTAPASLFPVTIDKSIRESGVDGAGNFESNPVTQSMTTAILNQAKDRSMATIDLEIRGDPYWLGVTNLEESFEFSGVRTNNVLASYTSGDMLFLLKTLIPQGLDNTTGEPILRKNEAFTAIYVVKQITHKFDKGNFTQSINAVRDANIEINVVGGF